ncbi:MAG: hypothetical protein JKY26_07330 [Pseudomonas sp.]|nr:hypothetical protein [Pseudomonas sp.]
MSICSSAEVFAFNELRSHAWTIRLASSSTRCANTTRSTRISPGCRGGSHQAANAGGVAVSGLEMSQAARHLHWESAKMDERLQQIMRSISRRV